MTGIAFRAYVIYVRFSYSLERHLGRSGGIFLEGGYIVKWGIAAKRSTRRTLRMGVDMDGKKDFSTTLEMTIGESVIPHSGMKARWGLSVSHECHPGRSGGIFLEGGYIVKWGIAAKRSTQAHSPHGAWVWICMARKISQLRSK